MITFLLFAALVAAVVAVLNRTDRRSSDPWSRPTSREAASDRDWARTRLDLAGAGANGTSRRAAAAQKPVAVDRPGQRLTPSARTPHAA